MKNNTEFSESFLLGVIAAFGGLITIVFASIRKSRCTTLKCCGMFCSREPMSEAATIKEVQLSEQHSSAV